MTKRYGLFAILFALLTGGTTVKGQTKENKHAFGINQDYNVYNVSISDFELGNFDSAISSSVRFSYGRYLSRTWEFNFGLSNGIILNQEQDTRSVSKSYKLGFDADIIYKFSNGKWLSESSIWTPYLSFGYNYNYLPGFKKAGLSPSTFANEYGLGSRFRIGEWSSINLQVAVNQELAGDFDTHMQYRLGYVQTIGKGKSETPAKEKIKDYDGDGIADIDDDCPTLIGKTKNGCPEDWVDPKVASARQDSLQEKLDLLLAEIQSLELVVDSLEKNSTVVIVKNTQPTNDQTPEEDTRQEKVTPMEPEKPVVDNDKPVISDDDTDDDNSIHTPAKPGDYYVIVSSTQDRKWAEAHARQLSSKYPTVRVLPQPNGYYRVGIYATRDRQQAEKILGYARENGLNGWLALEPDK